MGPINRLSALISFTYIHETEKLTLIQTIISHVFSANPSRTNLLYLAVEDARLVPLESIYDWTRESGVVLATVKPAIANEPPFFQV